MSEKAAEKPVNQTSAETAVTPEKQPPKFNHLHVHSHFSLLNALPKIPDLVEAAKEMGLTTLALTDNCNLYGAIEFYKECKKAGIKPILGIDAYVAPRTRFDKEHGIDNARIRLVLLAKDVSGYKTLIKLVTDAHLEGFYYKPRIDRELMEKYHDGIIAISSAMQGDISQAVMMKDFDKAKKLVEWYRSVFGAENFFIEISHHPEFEGHQDKMKALAKFAREMNVPIVAGQEVFYLDKKDRVARNTLVSIQNVGFTERGGFGNNEDEDFSLITPAHAQKIFKEYPDAIANSQKISDMCNMELSLGKWLFPNVIVESGRTHDDELRHMVFEGIKRRKLEATPELLERVEFELKVIKDKGYSPYFLVVADLLHYAHDNHILTTIRGSVAGSLVTYLSGITNVNPLTFKLPFERFLNPERPSAPDIDMDYADNRRGEMIAYAKRKYGADKVAQIGTFGTMMARGSVRDVTRALGHPYAIGDEIAKLIPMGAQGFPMTIDRAMEEVADLRKMYKEKAVVKEIIDMAKKIEGCARHISVHAAGVVISPIPLTDIVPLQFDTRGEDSVITQYDMHAVDENNAGLLKFDFLGIKNLAILADAVSLVKKIEGIDIDIENIPLDDKKTFEMLARGETLGLFQLNGGGMTRALIELKPTVIYDINVMVALYRPGPMDNINEYIARKQGKKPVTYMHPKMKNFLDTTFGVLVYQDDLLMTAIEVAGYTWGEVDKFRKAVGKKIPEEMAKQHVIFVDGCVKHGGMTREKAEEIWKLFEPFQGYGFNKAHAASYGKVAYQTAYMKANFPAIYMSAVLTADSGDVEKISEIISECKRMKIPVLAPDINESFGGFTVVKEETENGEKIEKIRFGLYTIKNFGEGIGNIIIEERKRGGKFKSLADFLDRVHDKNLNKKSLEALIKTGAMDSLGERGELLANLENILAYSKEKGTSKDQDSLFGLMSDHSSVPGLRLSPAPPATTEEKLTWERELLGLFISGHPLDKFREKLAKHGSSIVKTRDEAIEGSTVVVAGIVEEAKVIQTKKGDNMLFLKMSDYSGSIETVVFPRVLAEGKDVFVADKCIAIKGKITTRNGARSIVVDKAKVL
jgi:DNA polymerase-3 subunit alpha